MVPNSALRFKPADADEKSADKAEANGSRASGESRGKGRKRDNNSGTVYVIDGKELKAVNVQIGITDNRNTEITGGDLKPGVRVVVGDNPASVNKPSSVGMRLF